jgi:hypothetical protein
MEEDNLKAIFQASYQNPKEAQLLLEKKGYTYDTELSSPDTKVFIDAQGNPHVAFRGSHRAEDAFTDLQVGLGIKTKREKEAQQSVKQIQEKYKKPVSAYGTSLGGKLAEESGASQVYTYNKAVGVKDLFKKIPSSQTDIRTSKDIISFPSFTQYGGKKVTIQSPLFTTALKEHSTSALDFSKKKKSSLFPSFIPL